MALFLTQNLFVASGIDYLIYLTRPSHHCCNRKRPAGRVAELGSLIWLNTVKRTVLLRSGKSSVFFRLFLTTFLLDRVGDRNSFPAVINPEFLPVAQHAHIAMVKADDGHFLAMAPAGW